MSAAPYTLGYFTVSPNAASTAWTNAYNSDYAAFVGTLGAAPAYSSDFIDYSKPISTWVAAAQSNAVNDAATANAAGLTPVIAMALGSTASGSQSVDAGFQAFASGAYDSTLVGMVAAYAQSGFQSQVWRPGWEVNLPGTAFYANTPQLEGDYIAAFQHVYSVLHQAAQQYGVTMNVMWNPGTNTNGGVSAINSLYPGDSYVDSIGGEVYGSAWPYSLYDYGTNAGHYDTSMAQWIADPLNLVHYWNYAAGNQWSNNGSDGSAMSLAQLMAFAGVHGKTFDIPEAGAGSTVGGRDVVDDWAFPQWLAQQLNAAQAGGTKVGFVTLWDSYESGNFAFGSPSDGKPLEAAAWAKYFGNTPTVALSVNNDALFAGSPDSSVLLQGNGSLVQWQAFGTVVASTATLTPLASGWHAVTTGDFDGSGQSDVLRQSDDGHVAVDLVKNGVVTSNAYTGYYGTSWHVAGTGDFNGTGKSQIVMENNGGSVAIATPNSVSLSSTVVAQPGLAWHVFGTGDFNGDGKSDIFVQNNDGTVAVWQMNGATIATNVALANPGADWHAIATGDFSDDGKADVLFQNDSGTVGIWQLAGNANPTMTVVGTPGTNWHAVGTGDYNGDGRSDILFQLDDGTVNDWLMSGSTIGAAATLGNPGTSVNVVGQGGMNFINANNSASVAGTILNDDFDFATPSSGNHVITGFLALNDVITLDSTRFPGYAAVQANETATQAGTVINLGNNSTLTIAGVQPYALSAHNFI